MTFETVPCPYCNSLVTDTDARVVGRRWCCPRCGEMFPRRVAESTGLVEENEVGPAAEHGPGQPAKASPNVPKPRAWTNWVIAAAVLGVMAAMALFCLTFALQTKPFRRGQDKELSKPQMLSARIRSRNTQLPVEQGPVLVRTKAPADLEALGYLPAGIDVVVGIHVSDLLRAPEGKKFLSRQRLLHLGTIDIELSTGLRLEKIDHLVLGLQVREKHGLEPMVFIIQTVEPCEVEKIVKTSKALPVPGQEDRGLWMRDDGLFLRFLPGEHMLVVASQLNRLDDTAAPPVASLEKLTPQLRTMILERLDRSARVWVAGHVENWSQLPAKPWMNLLQPEDRKNLEKVRTFGIWLRLEPETTLSAAAACADDASAEALEMFVQRLAAGQQQKVKLVRGKTWVSAQATGNLETIFPLPSQPINER